MMMMMIVLGDSAERRLLGVSCACCRDARRLTRDYALVHDVRKLRVDVYAPLDDVRKHTEQDGDGDRDADDQSDVHRYRA